MIIKAIIMYLDLNDYEKIKSVERLLDESVKIKDQF